MQEGSIYSLHFLYVIDQLIFELMNGNNKKNVGTYWLRSCSQLEKNEQDKEKINLTCQKLEAVVIQIYVDHEWRFSNMLYV
jgi:hypothetical protein